jgi:radical SAM protein with 4Fe4S-binding SPASM domain
MKRYKKTYIEITNVCNLNCEFCPKTRRKPEFMSEELFEKILLQMRGRTKFLYFHIKGEPFLHPNLSRFLDLSEEYGFRVNITTNGTLIGKNMDFLIAKTSLRQLNFSLHSFNANENEYSMESYLNEIFEFIKRAHQIRPLQICLRLWNLTQTHISDINDFVLRRTQEEFNLTEPIIEKLTPVNGIKLVENVFLNQSERFEWPDLSHEIVGENGFCYGMREQVGFLVDGTVVPCCLDGEGIINFGNIVNTDFEDILMSKRVVEFYKGFSNMSAVEELCQKCSFKARFNR